MEVTHIYTGRTVDIKDIHKLFYAPPDAVKMAAEALVRAVHRGEDTEEAEAALGVKVNPKGMHEEAGQ